MASGLAVADTPTPELIRLMTGRNVENVFPPRRELPADAPVVLDVDGPRRCAASSPTSSSRCARARSSGSPGLVGSGRSEILETIYGARKRDDRHGLGRRQARCGPGSVRDAVNAGIGLSPEERKSQGLLLDEPIFKNVTLSTFARFARGPRAQRAPRARR